MVAATLVSCAKKDDSDSPVEPVPTPKVVSENTSEKNSETSLDPANAESAYKTAKKALETELA